MTDAAAEARDLTIDDRLLYTFPKVGYRWFPLGAYDKYGRVVVPVKVPPAWKGQLDEAESSPLWSEIFPLLAQLNSPIDKCYMLGVGFRPNEIRLMAVKRLGASGTKTPAEAGAWIPHLGEITMKTIQEWSGRRRVIGSGWLDAIRAILGLLGGGGGGDNGDDGGDDRVAAPMSETDALDRDAAARYSADAWEAPPAGFVPRPMDASTLARYGLLVLQMLVEVAAQWTAQRHIRSTVLWYRNDYFGRPWTAEEGHTWTAGTGGAYQYGGWSTNRAVASLVWDPIGRTFFWRDLINGSKGVWGPPLLPHDAPTMCGALYGTGPCGRTQRDDAEPTAETVGVPREG